MPVIEICITAIYKNRVLKATISSQGLHCHYAVKGYATPCYKPYISTHRTNSVRKEVR